MNFILGNLKAPESGKLLPTINKALKQYEISDYSRSYFISNVKVSSLKEKEDNN